MLKPRSIMTMFSVGLLAAGAGVASGQDYPNKPVRMVTAGPGAAGDFVARLVALGLTESWGQ
ncbi:MAG: tripartite tricarboxylate transporter substrate binding protein, partial [Betaproteobacteria bacterium]|nr:tripartite tricarboxylate transporter substrate binding protein [Betaproteobacteria bacterium]